VRIRLIACLIATDQQSAALDATKAAEAWLRENNQWYPWQVIQLAGGISGASASKDLLSHAEGLMKEAITMTFAGRKNRWTPDWTLGEWHSTLASIQSRLGKSIDAMDSAAAAIVLWSPWQDQRNAAIEVLRLVLNDAADLSAVIGHVDAQVATTGLENPILRKVLGRVLSAKHQHTAAIAQFELAMLATPEDTELFDLAVDTATSAKEWKVVEEMLRRRIAERPLDISPYRRLARLLEEKLANPAEAHRVATTMAEVSPNEVEGQSTLAHWYLEHGRFDEAMDRWNQVIRIKTDDPVGYLGKLRTMIRSGKGSEASAFARELSERQWPDTVTEDVLEQIKQVLRSEMNRPARDGNPGSAPSKSPEKPKENPDDKPASPPRADGAK
jgi:tetratricopeptide (TPR) repeat protein